MHTPTVSTFDLNKMQRLRVSSAKRVGYPLDTYRLEPFGLYFRIRSDVNDWQVMRSFVLPSLNLQVTQFTWQEGKPYDYDYYIDIIRVVSTGKRWVVRDLYLDILVYEGQKASVIDTDEYLEAISEGKLEQSEAEHALAVSHDTLNALGEHAYQLETYLQTQDIKLEWS